MAAPLEGIFEELFLSQFINGLSTNIKAEQRLLSPISLSDAMELANRIGEKNRVLNLNQFGRSYTNKGNTVGFELKYNTSFAPTTTTWKDKEKSTREFCTLTDQEL